MKKKLPYTMLLATRVFISVLLTTIIITYSCSSNTEEPKNEMSYTYNASELEVMQIINEYRLSIGLNELQQINHISYKSEEHDNYMINNNVVNHNNFIHRVENLVLVLGARRVGENIAYNYKTPRAVVNAWLNNTSHKETIIGDYTHFGIAIKADAEGRKYYTNIFIKI